MKGKEKYHLYLENAPKTHKDYTLTACNNDGYKVGGLIRAFFGSIKVKKRCKVCNRIYTKGIIKHKDLPSEKGD